MHLLEFEISYNSPVHWLRRAVFISILPSMRFLISPYLWAADSGDLLAAIATNGVAHPPGFLLYTFLAKFLAFILPTSLMQSTVLLSFLPFLGSFFLLFKTAQLIYGAKLEKLLLLSSLIMFFFAPVGLIYASVAEVFWLSIFFMCLLTYLLVSLYIQKLEDIPKRTIISLALLTMVVFSHQYIVLLSFLPALWLFWPLKKKLAFYVRRDFAHLLIVSLLFLLLLGFLFVSRGHSILNWTEFSFDGFWRLLLRSEYGFFDATSGFLSFSKRLGNVWFYFREYLQSFGILALLILGVGIKSLYNSKDRLRKHLLWNWLLYAPFLFIYISIDNSSNFFKGVLERYLLFSVPWMIFVFYEGLQKVFALLEKLRVFFTNTRLFTFLKRGTFLLLVISMPLLFMWRNLRTFHRIVSVPVFENHAKNLLNIPKANSMLILHGDLNLFPAQYLRYGLNYRQDIKLLSLSRLSLDYYRVLVKQNFPQLAFPKASQKAFMEPFLLANLQKTPVYTDFNFASKKIKFIQEGILYRVVKKSDRAYSRSFPEIIPPIYIDLDQLTQKHYFYLALRENYAVWYAQYAQKFYDDGQLSRAVAYYERAYELHPQDPDIASMYAMSLSKIKKCTQAENILMTMYYGQQNSRAAFMLSRLRGSCFKDQVGFMYWDEVYRKLEILE